MFMENKEKDANSTKSRSGLLMSGATCWAGSNIGEMSICLAVDKAVLM